MAENSHAGHNGPDGGATAGIRLDTMYMQNMKKSLSGMHTSFGYPCDGTEADARL